MQRKFFGTWGCGGQDLALMLPERKVPHWVAVVVAVVLASWPGAGAVVDQVHTFTQSSLLFVLG